MRSKIFPFRPCDDDPAPLLWRHSVPDFSHHHQDEAAWNRRSDPGIAARYDSFRNEKLMNAIEEYKQRYRDILTIRDEWIVFTPNDTVDEWQTSLCCLASILIPGRWTPDLQMAFEQECGDKLRCDVRRSECKSLISGKGAFEYAATNNLRRISSILWNILSEEEQIALMRSTNPQVQEHLPDKSFYSGPPQKRSRPSFALYESFVDVTQFTEGMEISPPDSPIPMCALVRTQQTNFDSASTSDAENRAPSDDSGSEDEFSRIVGVKKRRFN